MKNESQIWPIPHVEWCMKVAAIRDYIATGNIEMAYMIMKESKCENIEDAYDMLIEHLLSYWAEDPLIRDIADEYPWHFTNNAQEMTAILDSLIMRDVLYKSLCKAWKVNADSPEIIKEALYALCDVAKDGKLYCTPKKMHERLCDFILFAPDRYYNTLVSFFYFPNGMLRDFGHNFALDEMPSVILDYNCRNERKILNQLIITHLKTSNTRKQEIIMRAIANIKHALSYPLPHNLKRILIGSAQLIAENIDWCSKKFLSKYMIDVGHFKNFETPFEFAAQVEFCRAKYVTLCSWIDACHRSQYKQIACYEHKLEALEYAETLINNDMLERGLQLSFKIILSDKQHFEKQIPHLVTVIQEDEDC